MLKTAPWNGSPISTLTIFEGLHPKAYNGHSKDWPFFLPRSQISGIGGPIIAPPLPNFPVDKVLDMRPMVQAMPGRMPQTLIQHRFHYSLSMGEASPEIHTGLPLEQMYPLGMHGPYRGQGHLYGCGPGIAKCCPSPFIIGIDHRVILGKGPFKA